MFSIPFELEKSESIKMSTAEVFKAVADFNSWVKWSPWLCQEPDCPVTINGTPGEVGHHQAWDGTFIGAGNMQLVAATPGEKLDYEINFVRPWKSRSESRFTFTPKGDETEVTWHMKGSLPVFLFFMKKMMIALVGSDYSRGLSMLKEYLETGQVISTTEVKGVVDRGAQHYVGRRRSCAVSEVGPAMKEDFTELGKLRDGGQLPEPSQVFSIYHKFDMVGGQCDYTSGFLYDTKPEVSADVVTGQLPAHNALQVNHQGPYRHLGNAWSAAMGCSRSQHKTDKSVPMYEIYPNNPHEVDEADVRVEVYVPVRR